MSDKTAIEWTDATWNPTVGCSVISPGCTHCYAMRMAARLEAMSVAHEAARGGNPGPLAIYRGTTEHSRAGAVWTGEVRLNPAMLDVPLRWRRPRRIFVNSMSDLFHENLPDADIDRVFDTMALASHHTFQVLTKRPDRMRSYIEWRAIGVGALPNVLLGVSVEDQPRADERIPHLRETPAAVRFLSCEPLLERIDLEPWLGGIDWVIAGSESGPRARPCNLDWVRLLRDQCTAANVAFFWKQHVSNGRKISTPELDGRKWTEFPSVEARHA
jgi:protein gp37